MQGTRFHSVRFSSWKVKTLIPALGAAALISLSEPTTERATAQQAIPVKQAVKGKESSKKPKAIEAEINVAQSFLEQISAYRKMMAVTAKSLRATKKLNPQEEQLLSHMKGWHETLLSQFKKVQNADKEAWQNGNPTKEQVKAFQVLVLSSRLVIYPQEEALMDKYAIEVNPENKELYDETLQYAKALNKTYSALEKMHRAKESFVSRYGFRTSSGRPHKQFADMTRDSWRAYRKKHMTPQLYQAEVERIQAELRNTETRYVAAKLNYMLAYQKTFDSLAGRIRERAKKVKPADQYMVEDLANWMLRLRKKLEATDVNPKTLKNWGEKQPTPKQIQYFHQFCVAFDIVNPAIGELMDEHKVKPTGADILPFSKAADVVNARAREMREAVENNNGKLDSIWGFQPSGRAQNRFLDDALQSWRQFRREQQRKRLKGIP